MLLFFLKAFTSDFQVHWGQHLLRPEFIESTYFLYRATLDPYYLQVGEKVLRSLQKHARVTCGYASIKVLLNITNCYLCYCTGYFFLILGKFTTLQPCNLSLGCPHYAKRRPNGLLCVGRNLQIPLLALLRGNFIIYFSMA